MKKTVLTILIIVISLLGLVDASYVSYELFSGSAPTCRPPFQCLTVLEHPLINPGGIPLPTIGIFFYGLVFLIAAASLTGYSGKIPVLGTSKAALQKLGVFGLLFAIYVTTAMGLAIKAWCLYCVISATLATILFGVTRFLTDNTAEEIEETN